MSKARIAVTVESTTRLVSLDHATIRTVDEFKDYIHRELGTTNSDGELYLVLNPSCKVELSDADLPKLQTNDEIVWFAARQQQISQRPIQQPSTAEGKPIPNAREAKPLLHRWEEMFLLLKDFRSKHGHCNVPKTSGEVGRWADRQRIKYRKMKENNHRTLSNDQIKQLESIGFKWKRAKSSSKSMASYNIQFNKMKDKFIAYKKETGSGWVPQRYKQDPQLGTWAHRQRWLASTNDMKEDRRKVLDGVGFEWKPYASSKQHKSIKYKQSAQNAATLTTGKTVQSNLDSTSSLPTNQMWAFDLPDNKKVIYNSESLSTLPEGILQSMAICSLGTQEEVQFLLSLEKKSTVSKVSGGGPYYTVVRGDFFELFGFPKKSNKLRTSIESLQKLILKSISSSGKWNSEGRNITDASSMSTSKDEPQKCHSDWKKDWQKDWQKDEKIDERNYPLSILIPITEAGSYVQVWDPEKEGYAYVVHVKFGELIMFDPCCLHGGNIGGNYPRLHCFAVTSSKHSSPGGPYFTHCEGHKHSLQNFSLTSEEGKELDDSIRKELSLEENVEIGHGYLDEYLKRKGKAAPKQAIVHEKLILAYKASK